MKTVLVDANLLLRFLTNDVPAQAERVQKRLKEAEKGKLNLVLLPLTVMEVVFHLEHWYHFTKEEVRDKLLILFSPEWIHVEHKAAVFSALRVYAQKNIDFVDIFLWSIAAHEQRGILSFDKDFDKLEPRIRMEP